MINSVSRDLIHDGGIKLYGDNFRDVFVIGVIVQLSEINREIFRSATRAPPCNRAANVNIKWENYFNFCLYTSYRKNIIWFYFFYLHSLNVISLFK